MTFTSLSGFCVVSRWLPVNKSGQPSRTVVTDYLSDLGLHRIPCYALLHRTEVLSINCGMSFGKYRLSAMKNKNIGIG